MSLSYFVFLYMIDKRGGCIFTPAISQQQIVCVHALGIDNGSRHTIFLNKKKFRYPGLVRVHMCATSKSIQKERPVCVLFIT